MNENFSYKMKLTDEEKEILHGSKGEVMAKVMKTLVLYGDAFGAEKFVPVNGKGHLVTSFGISVLKPVFSIMDELIKGGLKVDEGFTVDPRPIDYANVKCNPLQKLIFNKILYGMQDSYEVQLNKLGLKSDKSFTCACYFDEVGNTPKKGDILSWAESSAVVFANSVLGARCNRNSGIIELFGSILGKVPEFDLLTDEGRKAKWIIEVKTTKIPEAQVLGSAIGMKVMEDVPYVKGLDKWIGTELTDDAKAYLKDFGAATASNGAVGLYHIENLTPEAVEQGEKFIAEGAQTYVIDDAELERVYKNYPVMWKDKNAAPKLCFIGCPHLSYAQLGEWTERFEKELKKQGKTKVELRTVMTTAPEVLDRFKKENKAAYNKLVGFGINISCICPLMYMNNPLCGGDTSNVITCSNKLRTYTTARYFTTDDITKIAVKGGFLIMSKTFKGRPVVAGTINKGEAVVSHNGVNTLATFQKTALMHDIPIIGKDEVIGSDQNNPDVFGKNLTGKVLCLPQTIGSTTGGMVLYTVCALNMAPAAMLFSLPIDSLAAAGVILSDVWTDNTIVAVDSLGDEFLNAVKDGDKITVKEDGTVIVE